VIELYDNDEGNNLEEEQGGNNGNKGKRRM
jgi:hypothetical protein